MPNHLHGIILITRGPDELSRGEALTLATTALSADASVNASPLQPWPRGAAPRSLNAVVQNFKSITTRQIHRIAASAGRPVWQRGYYEHVVRDDSELERVRTYIRNNPARWRTDAENITLD